MHPVLLKFQYFGETRIITSYGIFAIAGIFVASILIISLTRKQGLGTFDTINILALLVAGGLLFSLISHFLIFLPERLALKSFFALPAGLISWGGVLGGLIAALYINRYWKIPLLKLGDAVIPGVALGFAIGRIGCHFAGCCYGLHYDGPLAQNFVHPFAPASLAGQQPLFPIQLLSAGLLLLLCLVLLQIRRMNLRPGFGLFGYCLLYGMGRFIIEFFRDDARRVWYGFSDAQWYSFLLIGMGGVLFYYLRKEPKGIYGY